MLRCIGSMTRAPYVLSGLPRSGSTLLAAILRQTPGLHAGMSSPPLSLVAARLRAMSRDEPPSRDAIGAEDA